MKIFTKRVDEQFRGVELLCDTCNNYPDPTKDTWYWRMNRSDKYPSLWICNTCKESME